MEFINIIDYIGTFAFAISGIRLAAAKNFDWFGAYVVGFVTAVGGGTLRDLMLDTTPFWMEHLSYLIVTGLALIFVLIFRKYVVRLDNTFFIFDAVGIALFTVVGVEKSLEAGFPVWVNVIMGTITGAAGGMFRDIFINEVPLIFRKDIYAMACLLGRHSLSSVPVARTGHCPDSGNRGCIRIPDPRAGRPLPYKPACPEKH